MTSLASATRPTAQPIDPAVPEVHARLDRYLRELALPPSPTLLVGGERLTPTELRQRAARAAHALLLRTEGGADPARVGRSCQLDSKRARQALVDLREIGAARLLAPEGEMHVAAALPVAPVRLVPRRR